MPPPEKYQSEIGSQSTMCQVHTGAYVSLLAPGKTDYTACHPITYRQSSRFYSYCAFPRGGWCVGVLLYGSRKSVGSSVLRAFFASNACFARDEPSPKRVGGIGLSRKPPKLRSWRGTQPRAATATYSRRSRCWQNAIDNARCCRRVIHAAGKRS